VFVRRCGGEQVVVGDLLDRRATAYSSPLTAATRMNGAQRIPAKKCRRVNNREVWRKGGVVRRRLTWRGRRNRHRMRGAVLSSSQKK